MIAPATRPGVFIVCASLFADAAYRRQRDIGIATPAAGIFVLSLVGSHFHVLRLNGRHCNLSPTPVAELLDHSDPEAHVTRRILVQASIVPVVAVLIFVAQVYRMYAYDLTVWKGGGMGMFASIDGPSTRLIKVYLIAPDGALLPVSSLSPDLERLSYRASVEPRNDNLQALAAAVNRRHWVWTGVREVDPPPLADRGHAAAGPITIPQIGPAAGSSSLRPVAFTGTRLELVKIGFDLDRFAISARRALVFELGH